MSTPSVFHAAGVVRTHRRAGCEQDSTVHRVDGAPCVFYFCIVTGPLECRVQTGGVVGVM
jgi:hypothetical protein